MKGIKIVGYVLLALLFISTVPCAAEAGSVKIYPHQFKPMTPSDPHNYQTASYLLGNAGMASYYAVVTLPAGKMVTRVVVYHGSDSSSSFATVMLGRSKFGPTEYPHQDMANFTISGDTGGSAVAYQHTFITYPRVKSDFRYWLEVQLEDGHRLHGVKVVYE